MTALDGSPEDARQRTVAIKRDERRTAGVAWGAHALHDGYTDLIYVLLPIWQKEFGLGYAELGLLRALYAGTMAGFQIPAGLLAERLGSAADEIRSRNRAGWDSLIPHLCAALERGA